MFFKKCSFTMLLLVYLCALMAVMGCSSDSDEPEPAEIITPEEIAQPEPEPTPEPPPPHWADGTVTITIGRYETARELYNAVKAAGMHIGGYLPNDLFENGDFPLDKKWDSVEISVVSMIDVGMTKEATLGEVRDQFRIKGYRPLTIEESLELRRQFRDQPPVSEVHKMAAFFLLPRAEDSRNFGGILWKSKERVYGMWQIYHALAIDEWGRHIKEYPPMGIVAGYYHGDVKRFDPYDLNPLRLRNSEFVGRGVDWGGRVLRGSHFACVKIQ